jgi:large subunit ribosomal protein L29
MPTANEISEFDTEELERQLSETRRELFNLRFQLATGQLDNFSRIRHVRKDVARMMTELRIREIAEAEGMTLDEIPIHQAAARRRSEDEALGRSKTTAAERRAAARAEEAAEEEDDVAIDQDELAEEIADDDGMPVEGARDDVIDADVIDAEAAETETDTADTEAADAEEKRDG